MTSAGAPYVDCSKETERTFGEVPDDVLRNRVNWQRCFTLFRYWSCTRVGLYLHNWRMQDDASVPENQAVTPGTWEHALGEAAIAAAFDFIEERVCQKIEQQGIKLDRRRRKKVRRQLERMLRDRTRLETLSSIEMPGWTLWGQQEFTIQFSDQDQQDLDALDELFTIVYTPERGVALTH